MTTEIIKLPKEVVDEDWKDDVGFATYGTDKQEMEYVAPSEVSKKSIEMIKARKLNQKRGHRFLNLFTEDKKLAA